MFVKLFITEICLNKAQLIQSYSYKHITSQSAGILNDIHFILILGTCNNTIQANTDLSKEKKKVEKIKKEKRQINK